MAPAVSPSPATVAPAISFGTWHVARGHVAVMCGASAWGRFARDASPLAGACLHASRAAVRTLAAVAMRCTSSQVSEMNGSANTRSLTQHRKVAGSFRDLSLLQADLGFDLL